VDPAPRQLSQVIGVVLGVLAAVILIAAWMPRTAQAFTGESSVINPSTGDLTGPAKSILEKPTFLASEPGEAAFAGEASTLEDSLVAAGALPELSAILPWVAGAAIGSAVICEVFVGGCLEVFGSGSDPSKSASVSWNLSKLGGTGFGPGLATVLPGNYWTNSPTGFKGEMTQKECTDFTVLFPSEAQGKATAEAGSFCEPKAGKKLAFPTTTALRSGSAGRLLKQSPGPKTTGTSGTYYDPAKNEMVNAPVSTWGKNFASCLQGSGTCVGISKASRDHLGEKIASEVAGSEVADPFAVKVPDCAGLLWLPCKKELEELKLVPERGTLTWETAVVTKPADAVVEVEKAGSHLEPGTKVKVLTNPSEEGMPLVVPQFDEPERYSEYITKLAPGLKSHKTTICELCTVPGAGPEGVTGVSPEPGTRLNPAIEHELNVKANPDDAPAPIGGWVPPTVPSIDMSPLSGFSPCGVFPFGLFCWVGEALAQFNTSGSCPNFSAPVADTKSDFEVTLCGSTSETIMGYLRPAILLAFTVGLGFLFARGTKAIGGD
jgi:hypothetical protein